MRVKAGNIQEYLLEEKTFEVNSKLYEKLCHIYAYKLKRTFLLGGIADTKKHRTHYYVHNACIQIIAVAQCRIQEQRYVGACF